MNRIDRISALLIQLQSRSVVKAAQMADRFGVSLRTIYRDIRTLSEAGVPICGDAGIGYSLIEGYRLPPLMFTKEEAMAFLTAEKLIKEFTDIQNSRFFHQGMDKVRAVMRNVDKDGLASLDTTIEVYRSRNAPDEHYPNLLQTLLNSVNDQLALEISYIDVKEEISHRMIEVVGVTYIYPFWYLGAWCHLRNAYRNFRLDRIINIAVSQVSHTKKHPPLSSIIQSDEINDLIEVIVQTNQVVATYSADYSRFLGLIAQHNLDDGRVEQRYMTYSLEAMARWVLSHIDSTTIVSPPELIERIRTIISKINLSPTQNNPSPPCDLRKPVIDNSCLFLVLSNLRFRAQRNLFEKGKNVVHPMRRVHSKSSHFYSARRFLASLEMTSFHGEGEKRKIGAAKPPQSFSSLPSCEKPSFRAKRETSSATIEMHPMRSEAGYVS